jgi:hypothetical protein
MSKLYAILLTKNDDLIIDSWLRRHASLFDAISVVDGSYGNHTEKSCKLYSNIIYRRDPVGLITDQTLRDAAMQSLRPTLRKDDWIFIAHPDEFVVHNPRDFTAIPMPLILWLPLLVLPHPSERELIETLGHRPFDPMLVFKHYWWRTGQLPHCEFRMFRWVLPDMWDLSNPKKSSSVIPPNYGNLAVCNILPIYFHYKLYNVDFRLYTANGKLVDSGLDTGLDRQLSRTEDLYFDETNPWGDGYIEFDNRISMIADRFGNPPRSIPDKKGAIQVVNDRSEPIH